MISAERLRNRSISTGIRLEISFRTHGHLVFTEQLRRAICSYVHAMRAEGMLVERVIIGMKRIAERACLDKSGYAYREAIANFENDAGMQLAVSFCVARYYGARGVAP